MFLLSNAERNWCPRKMNARLQGKYNGGEFRYNDRDDSCLVGSEKDHSKLETLVLTLDDE